MRWKSGKVVLANPTDFSPPIRYSVRIMYGGWQHMALNQRSRVILHFLARPKTGPEIQIQNWGIIVVEKKNTKPEYTLKIKTILERYSGLFRSHYRLYQKRISAGLYSCPLKRRKNNI
jgi:hypothetical protein